ncbi:unnamed protein product [Amoebophrya sp. A25]|nr:unnamed protein product [Amoebophrya sp. A25]|eukprot:GSA25T00009343001.1
MADGGVATIFGVLQPEEEEILISELEVQHGPAVAKKMKRHFRSSANEDEKDEKILCQQLAQAASLSEDAAEKVIEWCRRIVHDMQQIGEEMREGGEDLPDGDEAEDGAPQAGSHVGGNSTNGNSSANNGGIAASGGPSGGIQLSTNSSSGGVVLQPASGNPSSGVVIHPANSNANGGAQDHNRNAGGSIITPAADRPRRQGGTLGIFASAVGQVKNQSRQGQQPPTVRPPQRARPSRSRSRSVASEEDVSDISNEEPRARANAREAAPPAKRFRADEDDVRAEESEGEQVRKKEKKLKKEVATCSRARQYGPSGEWFNWASRYDV